MGKQATCTKNYYMSLPRRIVIDNGIVPNDEEMYLVFEIGQQYDISQTYHTVGHETIRHVATKLKRFDHPSRKFVYDLFVTRNNPNEIRDVVIKKPNFHEYFKIEDEVVFTFMPN